MSSKRLVSDGLETQPTKRIEMFNSKLTCPPHQFVSISFSRKTKDLRVSKVEMQPFG